MNHRIGIIGGSGLYSFEGLEQLEKKTLATPFGAPSAPLSIGKLGKHEVVFLPRHGEHHQFLPSQINFRANIWALKNEGVKSILSVSATGSLRKEIAPGDLAAPDQYFDWTKGKRENTFFGGGLSVHISTAEPACASLTEDLSRSAKNLKINLHTKKTYACVEGPRLGTRAESFFLQGAGCDLVGMTNIPEAFLAREAQLCYSTLAVVTDYDCWMDDPKEFVSVEQVIKRYGETLGKVQAILKDLTQHDLTKGKCHCRSALEGALMSKPEFLTDEKRKILEFLKQ